MGIGKHAAMIPVAMASRTENMIFYFNDNWDDLASLLEAPVEFLRGEQFLWTQHPAHSISWTLIAPITASIECAYHNARAFRRLLTPMIPCLKKHCRRTDAAHLTGEDAVPDNAVAVEPDGVANDAAYFDLNNPLTLTNLHRKLKGSFAVEFNTYTSSINVLYVPPVDINDDWTLERPKKPGRFRGDFDGLAVIEVGEANNDLTMMTLHADLIQTSARMKADFMVGYLEDPLGHEEALNWAVRNKRIVCDCYMATPAEPIRRGRDCPEKPVLNVSRAPKEPLTNVTFVAGPPPDFDETDDKDLTPSQKWLRSFRKYSKIMATGLSDNMLTNGCSVGSAFLKRKTGELYFGDICSINYARIIHDPFFMVQDCLDQARDDDMLVPGWKEKREALERGEI